MKNFNNNVAERLDLLLLESKSIEFENQDTIRSYFIQLKEHIHDADYISFQLDGFSALKILIKSKRELTKTQPESDLVNSIINIINELRELLRENERLIDSTLIIESASHSIPVMAIILLVGTIACAWMLRLLFPVLPNAF